MAAAVRAGREAGFVPTRRPSPRRNWFIADRRPWPGPDLPGVWIRNAHSSGDFPEGPTKIFVVYVGGWRRSGPYHWRYAYPYTRGERWILAPDDPTDQLADGDILRPAGPYHYVQV